VRAPSERDARGPEDDELYPTKRPIVRAV
jgi:hypothetical protein